MAESKYQVQDKDYLLILDEGGSRYALEAAAVKEIINTPAVTGLFVLPRHVQGVINYKSQIIPVLSFHELTQSGDTTNEVYTMIVEHQKRLVGITTDIIKGMRRAGDAIELGFDKDSNIKGNFQVQKVLSWVGRPVLVISLREMLDRLYNKKI